MGNIISYIFFQSKITISLAVLILLMTVIMTIFHHIIVKKNADFKIWRLFCVLPLLLCVIHCIFFHFKGIEEVTVFFVWNNVFCRISYGNMAVFI